MKTLLAIAVSCVLSSVCAAEEAPSDEPVREAVTRSLPFLEQGGVAWREKRKCISCHRFTFLTWTHSEAGRRGFTVDAAKNREWNEWSVSSSLEKKGTDGGKNIDGLAQIILQSPATADALPAEQRAALIQITVNGQQPDGSWKAAGQLPGQKRPPAETNQVSTMWIALALGSADHGAAAQESRRRALDWLKSAEPGISTEWFAARLLLSHQEQDLERVKTLTAALLSRQNQDGGWGWLSSDPSDALGTGMALYALRVAGAAADDDDGLRRAQQFLISTQLKDGGWAVKGTKTARKDHIEETASYWGAGWATLGLLQTLP